MGGHSVRYVLAAKLVNELVEAADDKMPTKTIAGIAAGWRVAAIGHSSALMEETFEAVPRVRSKFGLYELVPRETRIFDGYSGWWPFRVREDETEQRTTFFRREPGVGMCGKLVKH